MNVSISEGQELVQKAKRELKKADEAMAEVKKIGRGVLGAVEATAAPFIVGAFEGRLDSDGRGHIHLGGVPVMLGAGGVLLATGLIPAVGEAGEHFADAAKGCFGSFGGDLGRELGLKWRLHAGYEIQPGALSQAEIDEIKAAVRAKNANAVFKALPGKDAQARVGAGSGGQVEEQMLADLVKRGAAASPA